MATYKKLHAMTVFLAVVLASCVGNLAKANTAEVCSPPSVTARLTKIATEYGLRFEVENRSSAIISIERFYFGENMLHLKAVRSSDSVDLKQVVPLLSPGVNNVVLSPGETFVQEVNLNASFPDLQQSLSSSDVIISSELTIQGAESCFSQIIKTSMTLRKSVIE